MKAIKLFARVLNFIPEWVLDWFEEVNVEWLDIPVDKLNQFNTKIQTKIGTII